MSDDKDSSHGSRPPGRLPRGVATPVPPDVADNPASDAQPLFPDLAAEDLGLDEFQEPGSEDIPTSLLVNIQHPSDSSSAYPLAEEDLESLRPGDGIPEDNEEFIPTIPPGAHRGSAHTGQAPAAAGASPRGLFSSEAAPVGPGAGLEASRRIAVFPKGGAWFGPWRAGLYSRAE